MSLPREIGNWSARFTEYSSFRFSILLPRLLRMLLASLIFLLTITLVIWQPKGLGVGWSATLGALLALLSGVVQVGDIVLVWQIIWNATGTFIALIIIRDRKSKRLNSSH